MSGYVAVAILIVLLPQLVLYACNENCHALRALRGYKGVLFATNRRDGVPKQQRPKEYWAWDLLDPSHSSTSCWCSPLGLGCFRLVSLTAFAFVLIYQNTSPRSQAPSWLTYFTHLSFLLFAATMLLGAGLAYYAWRQQQRYGEQATDFMDWALPQKAHLLLYVTAAVCSLAAAAFWWLAIYKPADGLRPDRPVEHGGSAALLLLDLLLSRSPIVSYHFQVAMGFVGCYAAFMWAYFGASRTWVYSALEWYDAADLKNYAALLVIVVAAFALLYLTAGLRELLATGRWCCACCCGGRGEGEGEGEEGEGAAEAEAEEGAVAVKDVESDAGGGGAPAVGAAPKAQQAPVVREESAGKWA